MQDVRHTWDAGSNLVSRNDVLASEIESFTYDFLDRLLSVSGPYTDNWTYNQIGNIVSHNGTAYTYGSRPHAVTQVGSLGYSYDANGNMDIRGTASGNQTITWDVENRPVLLTSASVNATFVYDGDGNRVKKIENGVTVLYINKYYEVNLTGGNATSYYYLGDRLVAMNSTSLRYIHQDHLTGTSLVTDTNGASVGTMKYHPFGETRSGSVPTDKKFTGQRLDDTGLYYYNARYYDPTIGRFISADTFVPWSSGLDVISKPLTINAIPVGLGTINAPQEKYPRITKQAPVNPQNLNRYTYVANNPLKYNDPSGWWVGGIGGYATYGAGVGTEVGGMIVFDDDGNVGILTYETAGGSGAGGPFFGVSGGAGVSIFISLNADTIYDLNGPSLVIGGSATVFHGVGSFGIEYVKGSGYSGLNINFGGSLGTKYEYHMFLVIGNVKGTTWSEIGEEIVSNVAKAWNIMMDLYDKDVARVIEAFQSAYGTGSSTSPGNDPGWSDPSYDPGDPYGWNGYHAF